MLTKFDMRSPRVKGVTFHPELPWVLCGLHNGVVQIWDYRMKTSVDTFTDHSGSVRGVDFHISQPLFVTGADDHLIKVWNFKLRRCLFTFYGHIDFIRTTFFHREQPWIVSASDDFTVRIWNWQNRTCVTCMPGHSHYVMCAQFHPTRSLVVSCSLDKTIRVWDIAALYTVHHESSLSQNILGTTDVVLKHQLSCHHKGVNWVSFDPTGNYIVSAGDDRRVVLWRLTGDKCHPTEDFSRHTHNVCCAVFYSNCVISCGEDRTIRVHSNTANGGDSTLATFQRDTDRYWVLAVHPRVHLIAAGHDSGLQVFKLMAERSPFAVMDDKRVYLVHGRELRMLDMVNNHVTVSSNILDANIHALNRPCALALNPSKMSVVVTYTKNRKGDVIHVQLNRDTKPSSSVIPVQAKQLVFYAVDRILYTASQNRSGSGGGGGGGGAAASSSAPVAAAAVDGKSRELFTCDVVHHRIEPYKIPMKVYKVFQGPAGYALCLSDASIFLLQVAQRTVVAEAAVSGDVRYVVWDKNYNKVALLNKTSISVFSRRLKPVTNLSEPTSTIKSAVFSDNRNFLFYTTSNHLKCCYLLTGEITTVFTLTDTWYLVAAVDNKLFKYDRQGQISNVTIRNNELLFKLNMQHHSFHNAIKILRTMRGSGQALVGYLHKNGFSEIALHFVKDPLTRFHLALESGAMDIATTTAAALNDRHAWSRLAEAAVRMGDVQLAQTAYSKSGNYYTAALLMLVTNNRAGLGHLIDTSKDVHFRTQYGMYVADTAQRVHALMQAGQLPLAYLTAASQGLTALAQSVLDAMDPAMQTRMQQVRYYPVQGNSSSNLDTPSAQSAEAALDADGVSNSLPAAPTAVVMDNWPLLQVEKSVFARMLHGSQEDDTMFANELRRVAMRGGGGASCVPVLGDTVLSPDHPPLSQHRANRYEDNPPHEENDYHDSCSTRNAVSEDAGGEGGWDDDDIDIHLSEVLNESGLNDDAGVGGEGVDEDATASAGADILHGRASGRYVVPNDRPAVMEQWVQGYEVAACHMAAGSFSTALSLLQRQIGLCHAAVLQPYMAMMWSSVNVARPAWLVPPTLYALAVRPTASTASAVNAPALPDFLPALLDKSRAMGQLFVQGRFTEARAGAESILHHLLITTVSDTEREGMRRELFDATAEYARALALQLHLRRMDANATEALALALHLTTFRLTPPHLLLALSQAMNKAYKSKNYILAAHMARRMLELNPAENKAKQARVILAEADRNPTNATPNIDYDPRNPVNICCVSHTVMPESSTEPIRCPYCNSPALPQYRGEQCPICNVSALGREASGLIVMV